MNYESKDKFSSSPVAIPASCTLWVAPLNSYYIRQSAHRQVGLDSISREVLPCSGATFLDPSLCSVSFLSSLSPLVRRFYYKFASPLLSMLGLFLVVHHSAPLCRSGLHVSYKPARHCVKTLR